MNILVNSQDLAAELRLMAKIVPSKPTVVILSHTLLTADDRGIAFYATDLENASSASCAGQTITPGSVAVPAAKLLAMIEQLPDADVEIEAAGGKVGISCGAYTARLQAMPTDDFPQPPEVEGPAATVDAEALRTLIAKTRHAINAAGTKFVLKGALLTFRGGVAAMVATDGKRLALATTGCSGADFDIVVPAKALDVLAGDLGQGEAVVTAGDRHLFFDVGGRRLTSRKLEGAFPAYERIVPRENDREITADRAALLAALRRIVLTTEETHAVYLDVAPGLLTLSSTSVGIGSAKEAMSAGYEGAAFRVCINGAHFVDFLNVAEGAQVTVALKDQVGSAALLTDGDHLGVIALMRV